MVMPNDHNERISFGVKILSDGKVIFRDVPGEVLDVMKELYPDDPQIKKIDQIVEKLNNNED